MTLRAAVPCSLLAASLAVGLAWADEPTLAVDYADLASVQALVRSATPVELDQLASLAGTKLHPDAIDVYFGNKSGLPVASGDSFIKRVIEGSPAKLEAPVAANKPVTLDCKGVDVTSPTDAEALAVASKANLDRVRNATGAISRTFGPKGDFLGTGWIVSQGFVVTNRHVVENARYDFLFEDDDGEWKLEPELSFKVSPTPDTGDSAESYAIQPTVEAVIPGFDLVVLRVDLKSGASVLPAAAPMGSARWLEDVLALGSAPWLGAIGFWNLDLLQSQYAGESRRRALCLADGQHGRRLSSYGKVVAGTFEHLGVPAFFHEASTAPGSSGSPIVDLHTGLVVGVHACAPDASLEECPMVVRQAAARRPDLRYTQLNLAWSIQPLCALFDGACTP